MDNNFKRGAVDGSTIVIILLSIALVGMGAFGIWSYMQYSQVSNSTDQIVELKVAEAKKEEQEAQEQKYAEREKEPYTTFYAPEDFGRVEFSYPKTWSSYVDTDGSNGDYTAYLHPSTVPPVPRDKKTQQRFALRVTIYKNSMENVLKEYEKTIEAGELSSSPVTANGKSATKLEGLFPHSNKDDRIRGTAYFFKVNDKTLMLRTDADTFNSDFNKVVNSIKFSS